VKKGFIYGSSDATATEPENDPLTVEDLAMTVYRQIGINGEKKLMAPGNRPIDIVPQGKGRKELIRRAEFEGAPSAALSFSFPDTKRNKSGDAAPPLQTPRFP